MKIMLKKGLNRNSVIGITPVWILPNIWRLAQVKNSRLGANVSNDMFLIDGKCQAYSFYRFWIIKGKLTGDGNITPCAFPFVEIQSASYPYL